LFATANALAAAKIDPDVAPRDARLTEPVAGDTKRILGQMARRGADANLVRALWAKLEGRPLERALVAVDVLTQALWSPRDPLLAELRDAASSLGPARPPAGELGIALETHPARALIERHDRMDPARPNLDLLALAYEMHLGALDELLRRDDDLLTRLPTRESIHAFARLAALARLPTLASVYFDWLVRGLGWRVPALDLCETMFDAGVAQKIPGSAMQPGDVPERDQRDTAEYLLYRAHLGVGDSDTANALVVQNTAQRARWASEPSLRVDVVRAHLGTLYGHGDVTLARVEAACSEDRLWRYGAMVRAIVAANRAPARAIELFHAYLAGFGNEFEGALVVVSVAPENVKRDIARIICREAFYLPHEPAPWKLLGVLFGVGGPVADEIDARLRSQSSP
jgi:hypothetical protein